MNDWVGGKIISADDKQVTMEADDGKTVSVSYENIAKAKFNYN